MPMRHVRACAFSCSQAESVHERGGGNERFFSLWELRLLKLKWWWFLFPV